VRRRRAHAGTLISRYAGKRVEAAVSCDLLAAMRAAYRIDGDDRAWLAGVLAPLIRAAGDDVGGWIASYDATSRSLTLGAMAGSGMPLGWRAAVRAGVRLVPADATRRAIHESVCATLSGLFGARFIGQQPLAARLSCSGVVDALGLNARDAGGTGVVVTIHLRRLAPEGPRDRDAWEKTAAHIAAGARLRASLHAGRGLDAEAEAILERDGRLAHAEPVAQSPPAQALLRRAALTLSELGALRGEDAARRAIDVWEGLVAGRWSLVEHFDHDGRRYFVARKNVTSAPRILSLTGRQRQVVALASLGHANKLIAYELGLDESTVSRHLRHAAERLGATSSVDLVRRASAHAGRIEPVRDDDAADNVGEVGAEPAPEMHRT